MRTLILAIGNSWRSDDGAAGRVLDRLRCDQEVETRSVLQCTPELAHDISGFDRVVFIDADIGTTGVLIESITRQPTEASRLSHVVRPDEIVVLSRELFGFRGEAYLCRIPVCDLSAGEGLSSATAASCANAARQIEDLACRR